MTPAPTHMAAWLESAWLARYLDRQLEGEELAWFEAYLLDKPELVDAVEADNAMRDSLAASSQGFEDGRAAGAERFQHGTRAPLGPISWAASMALAVGLGWLSHQTVSRSRNADLIGSPTQILVDTLRGANGRYDVEFPKSGSRFVVVHVSVPPDASEISIVHSGETVSLDVSRDGLVSFLVEHDALVAEPVVSLRYVQLGRHEVRDIHLDINGAHP